MAPDGDVRTAADSRHDHGLVVGAAVVNGLSGYLVLLIAARTLSPAENADFLVFWGALFALFGVTRRHRRRGHPGGARHRPRWRRAAVAGSTRVMPVVAAARRCSPPPWWRSPRRCGPVTSSGDRALPWTALLVAGCRALPRALRDRRDRGWAWTLADLRPARGTRPAGAAGPGGRRRRARAGSGRAGRRLGPGGGVLAGPASRCVAPTWPWTTSVGLDTRGFVRRILGACSASAASAVLIVGFPVLVRATQPRRGVRRRGTAAARRVAVPRAAPGAVERLPERRGDARDDAGPGGPARPLPLLVAAGTAVGMAPGALIGPWALASGQPRLPRGAGDRGAPGAGRRAGLHPHPDRRRSPGPRPTPASTCWGGWRASVVAVGRAGDAVRPDAAGGRLAAGRARGRARRCTSSASEARRRVRRPRR